MMTNLFHLNVCQQINPVQMYKCPSGFYSVDQNSNCHCRLLGVLPLTFDTLLSLLLLLLNIVIIILFTIVIVIVIAASWEVLPLHIFDTRTHQESPRHTHGQQIIGHNVKLPVQCTSEERALT